MRQKLIIGLGNPGKDYAGTYHNVGWEMLDFLKEKLDERRGVSTIKKGRKFHYYSYGDIHLIYPDTFMNASGVAVQNALEWFKASADEVVIIHDDSDLAIGEYKEGKGGTAGHHGVESILSIFKDALISRFRIGIRDPLEKNGEKKRLKAGDFVLNKIRSKEMKKLRGGIFGPLADKLIGQES